MSKGYSVEFTRVSSIWPWDEEEVNYFRDRLEGPALINAGQDTCRACRVSDRAPERAPTGARTSRFRAVIPVRSSSRRPDVRRRLALGVLDAAEAVALGVLEGLDACEGDYDGAEVLVLRRGPRRHLRVQNPRTDAHRRPGRGIGPPLGPGDGVARRTNGAGGAGWGAVVRWWRGLGSPAVYSGYAPGAVRWIGGGGHGPWGRASPVW